MFKSTISWILVAVISCTAQAWSVSSADRVTWTACEEAPSPFECTTIQVPLDWADRRKGLIPLSVIRLPASQQPRQGYMFYNPGGPGGSGTGALVQEGNTIQNQLGASWDVISWDPRGVLKSGPNITLFSTDREYADFWEQFQGPNQLEARGNLTTSSDVAFFMSQVSSFDAVAQSLDAMMVQKNGDNLKYLGTCAVTRDLVALVDAIYGAGSDVNFWGVSYGTIIATYLTQMFPNRVGKVIIDGVLEPYSYSNKVPMDWLETDTESAEQAFVKWTEVCVANPDKCTMAAKGNNTAEGVRKLVEHVLDVAYQNYDGTKWNPVLDSRNTTISSNPRRWTFTSIASQLYAGLYQPIFGSVIDAAIEGVISDQSNINGTTTPSLKRDTNSVIPLKRTLPYPHFFPFANIFPANSLSMVIIAIYCGDSIDYHGRTTKELFQKVVKTSQTVSRNFATLAVGNNARSMCHRWKSRAVERLPKKMNIKPKNVVLVIGNTEDPTTPYSSARTLASSKHLGNKARLVKYHTLGHTSSAVASACMDDVIRKYINGTPPRDAGNDEADIECQPDSIPFDFPLPS